MLEWILSSGNQQVQNLCKAVCFVLKALQIHQDLGKPWSQRGVQAVSPVPEQCQPLSACRCPDLMRHDPGLLWFQTWFVRELPPHSSVHFWVST